MNESEFIALKSKSLELQNSSLSLNDRKNIAAQSNQSIKKHPSKNKSNPFNRLKITRHSISNRKSTKHINGQRQEQGKALQVPPGASNTENHAKTSHEPERSRNKRWKITFRSSSRERRRWRSSQPTKMAINPKNHWKHEGMTTIALQTRRIEGFTALAK